MAIDIPRIHAVTDDLILAHPEFTNRARGVMRALGPRGAVHLRARYLTTAQIYAIALALGDAQESTECWLVVNAPGFGSYARMWRATASEGSLQSMRAISRRILGA